jgi:hypothetical protein
MVFTFHYANRTCFGFSLSHIIGCVSFELKEGRKNGCAGVYTPAHPFFRNFSTCLKRTHIIVRAYVVREKRPELYFSRGKTPRLPHFSGFYRLFRDLLIVDYKNFGKMVV